jgi:hypothetical protein
VTQQLTPDTRRAEANARKAANARRRRRLRAYGRYQSPHVDPGPARAHIAALREYGISNAAIGFLAGMHEGMIEQITHPLHRHRIRRETETVILRTRFDLDALEPRMQVDVAGTQRRIRALSAIGWSAAELSRRLGYRPGTGALSSLLSLRRRYVTAGTARAVRDVYAELSTIPGGSDRAVLWAQRSGWPPPMAWDDDTIDHPGTRPDLSCLHRPSTRTAQSVLEDVRWILHHDPHMTKAQVGARLGMEPDAVSAALKRAADAAAAAVYSGAPFGPVTSQLHDQAVAAAADVLAVREQMTDNAAAHGHNVNRTGRRKDDAA